MRLGRGPRLTAAYRLYVRALTLPHAHPVGVENKGCHFPAAIDAKGVTEPREGAEIFFKNTEHEN